MISYINTSIKETMHNLLYPSWSLFVRMKVFKKDHHLGQYEVNEHMKTYTLCAKLYITCMIFARFFYLVTCS